MKEVMKWCPMGNGNC